MQSCIIFILIQNTVNANKFIFINETHNYKMSLSTVPQHLIRLLYESGSMKDEFLVCEMRVNRMHNTDNPFPLKFQNSW